MTVIEVEVDREYHAPHNYRFMVFIVLAGYQENNYSSFLWGWDVDFTLVHQAYLEHVTYQ